MKITFACAGLVFGALALGCSDGSDHTQPPSSLTVVPTAAPEGAAGEMPPGDIKGHISVDLVGDGDEELAETFALHISTSDNSTPTATTVTGTIANDDTAMWWT